MWYSPSFNRRRKRTRSTRRLRSAFEILEDRCVPAGSFPGVPDVEGQFEAQTS